MRHSFVHYHWVYRDFRTVAKDAGHSRWVDQVSKQYIDTSLAALRSSLLSF